jgi:hypothetical protein
MESVTMKQRHMQVVERLMARGPEVVHWKVTLEELTGQRSTVDQLVIQPSRGNLFQAA